MFNQLNLYSSYGNVSFILEAGTSINFDLTDQEQDTLKSMCEQFYASRQMKLAEQVGSLFPQLADYSEVEVGNERPLTADEMSALADIKNIPDDFISPKKQSEGEPDGLTRANEGEQK